MQPLLSICIPTFNRSQHLAHTIDSIIQSNGFGDEIEIVISDNASTDDTLSVVKKYTSRYSNIVYYRNEENVRDCNFPLALDRGKGLYLKLNNDNRPFLPDALDYMLDTIKAHIIDKTPIIFTSGFYFNTKKGTEEIMCKSLDDFIVHFSFYSTAIWAFGAWKEDWAKIEDKMKYSPLQLSQVDWFYQMISNRECCLLKTKEWGTIENIGKRTGYKWLQVHVDNYYTIIKPYYNEGKMSKKAWKTDHKLQLKRMKLALTSIYVYNLMPEGWDFDMSGAPKIFWKNFKSFPYFYWYILTSPIWMLRLLLGRLLKNVYKRIKR